MVPLRPGPPKRPKTFCAPCATKITPRNTRTIRSGQLGNVAKSTERSMRLSSLDGHRAKAGGVLGRALGALVAAREFCRQGAVVRHGRMDLHHKVAGGISQHRSHPASVLALKEEASLVDPDLAPSAGFPDRLLGGHDVVRTVLPNRQRDIFRLEHGPPVHD